KEFADELAAERKAWRQERTAMRTEYTTQLAAEREEFRRELAALTQQPTAADQDEQQSAPEPTGRRTARRATK
ncbi:MAG: hypothetical protein JO285_09135, partial [Kutzneria sp.]|nr:hypothetical protein [Kutzneria sp.]